MNKVVSCLAAAGMMAAFAVQPAQADSIVSELRVGALAHSFGPFSDGIETGLDINGEVLFKPIPGAFFDFLLSPRPHVGVSINTAGETSQVYGGFTWEWTPWKWLFFDGSLGLSVHDGHLTNTYGKHREFGARLLFRESIEAGVRFGGHSVSVMFDHISHGGMFDENNHGMDNIGVRYGYRF